MPSYYTPKAKTTSYLEKSQNDYKFFGDSDGLEENGEIPLQSLSEQKETFSMNIAQEYYKSCITLYTQWQRCCLRNGSPKHCDALRKRLDRCQKKANMAVNNDCRYLGQRLEHCLRNGGTGEQCADEANDVYQCVSIKDTNFGNRRKHVSNETREEIRKFWDERPVGVRHQPEKKW